MEVEIYCEIINICAPTITHGNGMFTGTWSNICHVNNDIRTPSYLTRLSLNLHLPRCTQSCVLFTTNNATHDINLRLTFFTVSNSAEMLNSLLKIPRHSRLYNTSKSFCDWQWQLDQAFLTTVVHQRSCRVVQTLSHRQLTTVSTELLLFYTSITGVHGPWPAECIGERHLPS